NYARFAQFAQFAGARDLQEPQNSADAGRRPAAADADGRLRPSSQNDIADFLLSAAGLRVAEITAAEEHAVVPPLSAAPPLLLGVPCAAPAVFVFVCDRRTAHWTSHGTAHGSAAGAALLRLRSPNRIRRAPWLPLGAPLERSALAQQNFDFPGRCLRKLDRTAAEERFQAAASNSALYAGGANVGALQEAIARPEAEAAVLNFPRKDDKGRRVGRLATRIKRQLRKTATPSERSSGEDTDAFGTLCCGRRVVKAAKDGEIIDVALQTDAEESRGSQPKTKAKQQTKSTFEPTFVFVELSKQFTFLSLVAFRVTRDRVLYRTLDGGQELLASWEDSSLMQQIAEPDSPEEGNLSKSLASGILKDTDSSFLEYELADRVLVINVAGIFGRERARPNEVGTAIRGLFYVQHFQNVWYIRLPVLT
ncbi:MAG: hypothetical protein BJ554DRAFT_4154, partial [Olpidium bornovanus]